MWVCGKEWEVCGTIYLGVVRDWKFKRTIVMLIKFTV